MHIEKIKTICCNAEIAVRVVNRFKAENYCGKCKRIHDVKDIIRAKNKGKL